MTRQLKPGAKPLALPNWDSTAKASELEPRDELNVTLSANVVRIDEAEPAAQFACRVACHRSRRIARRRPRQIQPVEDIEKFRAQLERHSLLDRGSGAQRSDSPIPAAASGNHCRNRARNRNVPGAASVQAAGFKTRFCRGSMQWQFGSCRNNGCPCDPVLARRNTLPEQRRKIVVGIGHADQRATRVTHQTANRPVAKQLPHPRILTKRGVV